jgi:hypothetical protein
MSQIIGGTPVGSHFAPLLIALRLVSAKPHGTTRITVIATVDTTRSHACAPVRNSRRMIRHEKVAQDVLFYTPRLIFCGQPLLRGE